MAVKQIGTLQRLVRLRRDVRMGELAQVRRSLADLREQRGALANPPVTFDDAAGLAQFARWQMWRQQELGRLAQAEAQLRAREADGAFHLARAEAAVAAVEALSINEARDGERARRRKALTYPDD
ncbi:hypothetical protein [Pelagovum sp. HNIBRBA483]|uniref:hypothetical protein n=1 Tax=Pelagovum sp. HNIBRBA483 TaxID=3233341 RepID=UPI0034A2A107